MDPTPRPKIIIVDDECEVTRTLELILKEIDAEIRCFSQPSELLELEPEEGVGCFIIDLRLPQMDGLQLLRQLRATGWPWSFLVITGFGEVPDAVSAMRQGAVDFIEKPWDNEKLVASVRGALDRDRRRCEFETRRRHVFERLERLTPREHQVLNLVVKGKLNKQIAENLGVAVKTVETHRSRLTRKLEADSVAELVRIVLEAQQ